MSRADVEEFLARVDEVTAPTCGTCARTLDPDGPSMYFCDDACSQRWHETQAEPLVGYREPWWRPHDFPGVATEAFRPNAPETTDDDLHILSVGTGSVFARDVAGEWQEIGHVRDGNSIRFSIHDETLDGGRTIVGEPPLPRCEVREFAPPPPNLPEVTSAWDGVSVSWEAADLAASLRTVRYPRSELREIADAGPPPRANWTGPRVRIDPLDDRT